MSFAPPTKPNANLMAKQISVHVQDAAENDVDATLFAMPTNHSTGRESTSSRIAMRSRQLPVDHHGIDQIHSRQRSGSSHSRGADPRFSANWAQSGGGRAQVLRRSGNPASAVVY